MEKRTLSAITYLVAGLTWVSCILSIRHNNIYQDGEWANAQWLGQDIVTILIALPFLLISFIKGIKSNDNRWGMVYCGILLYYGYTYSFFMFAADLTILYLFHLPIYGLSVIGLIIALIGLFNHDANYAFESKGIRPQ